MSTQSYLFSAAERIEKLNNEAEVWEEFENVIVGLEFKFFIYLTTDANRTLPILKSNVGLHEVSETQGVFDPFLEYCCHSYDITKTGNEFLSDYPYLDKASKNFIENASNFGFLSGLGIPMRLTGSDRFGGFNLGTGYDRISFEDKIFPIAEKMRLFCLIVHRRIEELQSHAAIQQSFRNLTLSKPSSVLDGLSGREQEVLFLLSQGFSRAQMANLCKISTNTASGYVKSIYEKLGVNNKAEATRIAVESKLNFTSPKL